MKYGKHSITQAIDDKGSSKTSTTKFRDGLPTGVTEEYFEYRNKVLNDLEVMAQFSKFYKEVKDDHTMLHPSFKIDGRFESGDGRVFTINCFTRVMK